MTQSQADPREGCPSCKAIMPNSVGMTNFKFTRVGNPTQR
jgi:hypothetical protein